jgi:hypothetical protein
MTNEEFIQHAAKLLETKNKIPAAKLKDSVIRDAKVVCFKLGTDLNAMAVFDAKTGEQLYGAFGPNPLIQNEPKFYASTRI